MPRAVKITHFDNTVSYVSTNNVNVAPGIENKREVLGPEESDYYAHQRAQNQRRADEQASRNAYRDAIRASVPPSERRSLPDYY